MTDQRIPIGGGTPRRIGTALANREMNVVPRTMRGGATAVLRRPAPAAPRSTASRSLAPRSTAAAGPRKGTSVARALRIAGEPAVISGAASGIGRALARRLSALGSPVADAEVDAEGLEKTAAALPGPVLARVLDVRDADGQRQFADQVRSWLTEPLAAVFNNAGVAVGSSVLQAVPEDDQWLWDINFHGVVKGTRAFLPLLAGQDSGAIVNTSSVFGLMGIPYQSAYCASKFAVRGFTDSLRQELRDRAGCDVTVGAEAAEIFAVRDAGNVFSGGPGEQHDLQRGVQRVLRLVRHHAEDIGIPARNLIIDVDAVHLM